MTRNSDRHSALVLICKRPLLGQGKQRLAATRGAPTALCLANALLECALEDLRAWPGAIIIAYADTADVEWAEMLLPGSIVVSQGEGNLGERLQSVDKTLRRNGHVHCLFIGSDAPALTINDYLMAEHALIDRDVVLTPARDGGVVLMGNRHAWPALADLPWSTPQLGIALMQRCNETQRSVACLTENFDIDEDADLQFCRAALSNDRRPARRQLIQLITTLCNAQESSDAGSA